VDRRRDLGGVIFIGLRDRYGVTQVVIEPEKNEEVQKLGKLLRNEFVVSVEGTVRKRPADQVNKEMTTGELDVVVENLEILNEAETPPFAIKDNIDAFEDLRLKYRYLDLRRPVLQKNLLLRHRMYQIARKYFDENNFIEIETPVLMKSTPEGARDYLVPSRIHKKYDEAMEKYGSDKPDLRFALELVTLNNVFRNSEFKVFKEAIETDEIVTGIVAPGCSGYSRNQIDNLTAFVKNLGAKGLVWLKVKENEIDSPIAKFLSDQEKKDLCEETNAKPGDLILILAGKRLNTLTQTGSLRLEMAKRLELIKPDTEPKLLWVTDFPLFEWDEATKRFYAMHHPFTSPRLEDIPLLESDPGKVKARAYDLVLNGHEIAGGSIRIHNSELQAKMFKALGISKEEAEKKFGFLMNAFKYGAPPHGGIAFGFDRMVMIFAGESSIRDTIAFPKTSSALSLMDNSPSEVSEEQLKELHIKIN
ncbi:MAG: aspartate--tRNA ligase, partial [Ignavibacteriaceae bacterium]